MKNSLFRTLLFFEIGLIVCLLCSILTVTAWSGRRRNRLNIAALPLASTAIDLTLSSRVPQTLPDAPLPEDTVFTSSSQNAISPDSPVKEIGLASFYQDAFQGQPTASGEPYNPDLLTGAHRRYPFGTLVRVINLKNGRDVVVRINDRGPHKPERLIDVSGQAARAIGLFEAGLARVKLEVVR